jgi:hypothetical protein
MFYFAWELLCGLHLLVGDLTWVDRAGTGTVPLLSSLLVLILLVLSLLLVSRLVQRLIDLQIGSVGLTGRAGDTNYIMHH